MKTLHPALAALALLYPLIWSTETHALPITQNFSGVQLDVIGEYTNGVPVSIGLWEFAPSFQLGQTVTGFIAYDTNQPDTDPGQYGTYRIGALSVDIPQLGLSVSRNSNNMQISAFDNTPNPDDQFFAYVNGVDSFSSNVGLPNPINFSVSLLGDTSMLTDDLLPISPLAWTFGGVSFDFLASDHSWRQVLMTFSPAPAASVPEPVTIFLFGASIVGFVLTRVRGKKKGD
ncbi:MAG: PEP-CTERM sorting domain-containing protein [Nitrosomonas sp.]|nr:PEP-CTERM sorting domain-containing protein [Nitrosomonas sp.]